MRRAVTAYGPAAVWAVLLLVLGAQARLHPPDIVLPLSLPIDKVAHFAMYGVLGGLAAWGWRRAGRWPSPILLILGGILVGAMDELHQASLPHRAAEWGDWFADIAGIFAGFLLVGFGLRGKNRG